MVVGEKYSNPVWGTYYCFSTCFSLSDFNSWLSWFLTSQTPILITSEFNFHVDEPCNPFAAHFLTLTSSFNLQPWFNSSIYEKAHSIWSPPSSVLSLTSVAEIPLSNHLAPFSITHHLLHPSLRLPTTSSPSALTTSHLITDWLLKSSLLLPLLLSPYRTSQTSSKKKVTKYNVNFPLSTSNSLCLFPCHRCRSVSAILLI